MVLNISLSATMELRPAFTNGSAVGRGLRRRPRSRRQEELTLAFQVPRSSRPRSCDIAVRQAGTMCCRRSSGGNHSCAASRSTGQLPTLKVVARGAPPLTATIAPAASIHFQVYDTRMLRLTSQRSTTHILSAPCSDSGTTERGGKSPAFTPAQRGFENARIEQQRWRTNPVPAGPRASYEAPSARNLWRVCCSCLDIGHDQAFCPVMRHGGRT